MTVRLVPGSNNFNALGFFWDTLYTSLLHVGYTYIISMLGTFFQPFCLTDLPLMVITLREAWRISSNFRLAVLTGEEMKVSMKWMRKFAPQGMPDIACKISKLYLNFHLYLCCRSNHRVYQKNPKQALILTHCLNLKASISMQKWVKSHYEIKISL